MWFRLHPPGPTPPNRVYAYLKEGLKTKTKTLNQIFNVATENRSYLTNASPKILLQKESTEFSIKNLGMLV